MFSWVTLATRFAQPSEQDGKTLLTSTMVFPTIEERDAMIASGMEPGASESSDRLAALLKSIS
jgi:uncharacterized protein YndB with AHSA1/START domain